MGTERQLSLWDVGTPVEENILFWKEMHDLKETQNNLRRGFFQRYDIMNKEIQFLKEQIELLKSEKTE
ncbi:hypothetical protein [Candidatus Protochlamydia amoebophila]|uniref:Uncharacterized protein n=1 Tax=Protochlamydia amoebophila (strain UWE25) TaxID=264201 RepID=Q6MBB3_PARUW|nr:hypothetical protein [Candidatus Protochlamydia amoebophila]CAF24136.1 unnamed protein product [Candidatus Protochlamydia amoebophila UWE25]